MLKHELKICDKFLTWGWRNDDISNKKVVPYVSFPIIKKKFLNNLKKGNFAYSNSNGFLFV